MARNRKRKKSKAGEKLSPVKYIKTRARNLPVWKCYISKSWREEDLAHIFVIREHTNGNITYGSYLVDLACKGVKDTFFNTNVPKENLLDEIEEQGYFVECDYKLAHNIIFEAIEYAEDYGFNPHKDFAVSKYILEKDDDNIELMEIRTGGRDGRPHLVEFDPVQAGKDIEILKKTAGEGNFDITVGENFEDWDSEEFEDDFEDEFDDEFDENEDIKSIEEIISGNGKIEEDEIGIDDILKYIAADYYIDIAYQKISGVDSKEKFAEYIPHFDFDKVIKPEETGFPDEMEELFVDLDEMNIDYMDEYAFRGDEDEHKLYLITEEANKILEKENGKEVYIRILSMLMHSFGNANIKKISDEFLEKYPVYPAAMLFVLLESEDEERAEEFYQRLNKYKYISITPDDAALLFLTFTVIDILKKNILEAEGFLHVYRKIQKEFGISMDIEGVEPRILFLLREAKKEVVLDYKEQLSPKEERVFHKSVSQITAKIVEDMRIRYGDME